MRAPTWAVLILRDARTPIRLCRAVGARALLRMRTAELAARRRTVFGNSRLTMSNSHSRSRGAFLRPGFATLLRSPESRGGRSAERRSGARRNTRGARRNAACQALARRLASHDAGRSPLGAPPWRFWAPGPRFRLLGRPPSYDGRQAPSESVQRAPRTQVVVPGGRGPEPPGASGYEPPAAGRHASLRLQDRLRRRPSMSETANVLAWPRDVVKSVVDL
jgi:hypothetical protein